MSTTLTPPPLPTTPEVAPPPRPPAASSRVIAILTVALGAAVVVGTIATSVVSTVAAASVSTDSRTVAVDGVRTLDTDLAAGSLRIEFADVSEAQLQVTSAFGFGQWTFERSGDTLEVASPQWRWTFPWTWRANGNAVLQLPESMRGVDATMKLAAGDLTASGDFGDLELDLGAGQASIDGSADSLTADLSAGGADLDLQDVRTAHIEVSAGTMDAALTGRQPDAVTVDISAGSLDLTVPDGDYAVTSDVSAGGFDNRIGSAPDAASTVNVKVSAGSATLRSSA